MAIGKKANEVTPARVMALEGAIIEDGDRIDVRSYKSGLETSPHHLHLGKLRHGYSLVSESSVHAVSAAAISACFLLVPSPVAVTSEPTCTVAVKTRA